MSNGFRWYCGIDWASKKHNAYLLDAAGTRLGERVVEHGGTGLGELCRWLVEKTGGTAAEIAVAIETPSGPVVQAFLEQGFAVFSINPKQLDRFRDRFSVSGAKDDSRDSRVLGESLRTDERAFRRLAIDDPTVIELRECSRVAEDLTAELNRLGNRLRDQLWRYYPQLLDIAGDDVTSAWVLALWQLAPTPQKAAKLNKGRVEALLKTHRVRRITAVEALDTLRRTPLTPIPGAIAAAMGHIELLLPRIRLASDQLKAVRRRMDRLCAALEAPMKDDAEGQGCEHRDATILRSMPGLGRNVLATMLAEAPGPLQERDYHALRVLSGQAPVTRRSGRSCVVLRRYACNKRLATALYHWSRVAVQCDEAARRRYAALRQRGHSHGRALRTIGDRLLSVACTLLRRGVLYDAAHAHPRAAPA